MVITMQKTIVNGSIAHTVGNVTTLMTEYLKSLFPDNYFRHIHTNTRMVYREQKREENSDYEFIKKNKPILVIRPRVDIANEDIAFSHSLLIENQYGFDIKNGYGNFQPFFYDKENGIRINYLMGRIRVAFDCTLMVDTEFEQINQYFYMLQRFVPDRVYRMHTALEVYIPPSIMELVSVYSGVPIVDEDTGLVKPFLDYMMTHSNKYITFKERTSSSTRDFFMYYPLNIDYVFTDFSKEDPSKKNWVSYSCNINFSVTCEFNTVSIYNFLTSNMTKIIGSDVTLKPEHGDGINIIPYFTIGNLFDKTTLDNGFEMFYTQAFETDLTKADKPDTLELAELLERTNIKEILEWHKKQGVPNTVFLQFIIMENNEKLTVNKDYTIDWDNFSITILKSNPDKTYRLAIFLNNLYVNQFMENFNAMSNTYEQQVGRVTDKTIRDRETNEIGVL